MRLSCVPNVYPGKIHSRTGERPAPVGWQTNGPPWRGEAAGRAVRWGRPRPLSTITGGGRLGLPLTSGSERKRCDRRVRLRGKLVEEVLPIGLVVPPGGDL